MFYLFEGTYEERGIAAWHVPEEKQSSDLDTDLYDEGYEVYQPLLPRRVLNLPILKYIPFLPHIK